MISLILILSAVGAYFLLKKNLVEKFPKLGVAKIGATIGVPLFYMIYSISEVVRLWGAGNVIFNTTGYQRLISGTDAEWDANVLASAINNMGDETRNAWAFVSMAESCSQYMAIIVAALGVVMIYKLFNPTVLPKWKFPTMAIIAAICCVLPYLLYALGGQNVTVWLIFMIAVAIFGWTYYLYKNSVRRMANVSVSGAVETMPAPVSEATKQCPYCGETILAVAKKCKHCGEWLPEQSLTTESESKYIECPVCGEEIEPDATICPYCNEPVPAGLKVKSHKTEMAASSSQIHESPIESNNRIYIWIALAIIAFVLLFWYLKSNSNHELSSDSGYEQVESQSCDNDDDFLIN